MGDVVDYSYARPSPSSLVTSGYIGAIRYLSHEPSKDLQPAERDALFAAGLSIGLVWETTANRALSGFSAGQADGAEANNRADALGWPRSKALIYAVDFGAQGSQMVAIRNYFKGVKSVSARPVGVYGSYYVLQDLAAYEPVHCYWQCAAWSGKAASGGVYIPDYGYAVNLSKNACLFQYYGSVKVPNTDHNAILTPEVNDLLWNPSQPPPPMEDLMARPILCADHGDGFPHTGDAQWQTVYVDGKPHRRFLAGGDPGRLVLIGELESADPIELAGEDAAWYLRFPDVGNLGPFLARPKADSAWVVEQLKEPAGSQPTFLFEGRICIRIHDDHQFAVDRFIGVRDAGELDDVWFYNQSVLPWVLDLKNGVDIEALAAAIAAALNAEGVPLEASPETIEAIAQRTAEVLHDRLAS